MVSAAIFLSGMGAIQVFNAYSGWRYAFGIGLIWFSLWLSYKAGGV